MSNDYNRYRSVQNQTRHLIYRLTRKYDLGVNFCVELAQEEQHLVRDNFHGREFDLQLVSGDGVQITLAEAIRVLELSADHLRKQLHRDLLFGGIPPRIAVDDGKDDYLIEQHLKINHDLKSGPLPF